MATTKISLETNTTPTSTHHGIIDFSSQKSLPDSHAWAGGYSDRSSTGSDSIPVVDLMDPNAMEAIGVACENWGAFQLINHGIPITLFKEVELHATRLFALPVQEKFKAQRLPDTATGYGQALISPFFPKAMWHEGFTIIGSPAHDINKIWPNQPDNAHFCDVMLNYQEQMRNLAEKLTNMLLKLSGLTQEEMKWVGSNSCSQAFQLNSYPLCPDPDRAMGLAPHTDTSLLTILHQTQYSPDGGLQVVKPRSRGGMGWVPVRPHPDALDIHVGDLLHIISNAKFPSLLHRVTVNRTRQRYSFAYFYGPPKDFPISPLSHEHPRFRALTVKEYVAIKGKDPKIALSSVTLDPVE